MPVTLLQFFSDISKIRYISRLFKICNHIGFLTNDVAMVMETKIYITFFFKCRSLYSFGLCYKSRQYIDASFLIVSTVYTCKATVSADISWFFKECQERTPQKIKDSKQKQKEQKQSEKGKFLEMP